MADQDDGNRKTAKTNAGFEPRPPGLGGGGLAPRGSTGTKPTPPDRESDLVISDVYFKDGDQFKGPYILVHTPPGFAKEQSQTQEKPQEPDNLGKVHFDETGDEEVDRHYQEQGEVMVPDPGRQAQSEAKPLTEAEARSNLRDIFNELRAEDRGDEPNTDRHFAQNAEEQGRDLGGLSDDNERSKGRER